MNQAKVPMLVVEPMTDEPVQGATVTNGDNLSAAGRRPVSVAEEPTVFMTRSKVDAMLRRDKEKRPVSTICMYLKSPYVAKVATKLYSVTYVIQ